MKIGQPILREDVGVTPVEQMQERVRKQMVEMMQPPVPDSVVYSTNKGYLSWVVFIAFHVVFSYFLFWR